MILFSALNWKTSNTPDQIAQTNFHRRRNPHEGVHGDVFFTAFNVADVVVVEVGLLGELDLAPAQLAAMRADVFT